MSKSILAFGICFLLICSVFIPMSLGFNVKVSTEKFYYKNKNGEKTWIRIIGGDDTDFGCDIQQTSDGDYIIAGQTYSFDIGHGDGWLLKIDENGNTSWNKTFGDKTWEYFSSVYQTSDDGFILSGEKYEKCWLLKTDSNGNQIWNKTYRGLGKGVGYSVIQTRDKDFFLCGHTCDENYSNGSIYLLRVDEYGNELWNITFGYNEWNYAHSCKQTLDGGFIVTGDIYNEISGYPDAFLLKIDANGDEEWFSTYNSDNADYMEGYDVIQNSDGSYVMVGILDKDCFWWFKGFMLKTDFYGNELWRREFSNFLTFTPVGSVYQTNDGGYIIVGEICNKLCFDLDLWLAKTDDYGNLKWTRRFGEKSEDFEKTVDSGGKVQQTTDGGYIVLGHSNSYGIDKNDMDILLIKTDSNGYVPRNKSSFFRNTWLRFFDMFPIMQRMLEIIK